MRKSAYVSFITVTALIFSLMSVFSLKTSAKTETDYNTAYERLITAIDNLYDGVDVSDCFLEYKNGKCDFLSQMIDEIRNSRPDLLYVKSFPFYRITVGDKSYIGRIFIEYEYDKSYISVMKSELSEFVSETAEKIKKNGLSDTEKVLVLHDYLIGVFDYDYDYSYGYESNTPYGILKNKVGVCQAYTGIFGLILTRLGIENSYAKSSEMNHIWNVVKLDGSWYHVDLTWDDTGYYGLVSHENFLKSDKAIRTEHYGWECDYLCTSEKYDCYLWINFKSPFAALDGKLYCVADSLDLSSGRVAVFDCESNSVRIVCEIDDCWKIYDGTRFVPGMFSGMNVCGKSLVFNDSKNIYSYDTETKTKTTLFTLDKSESRNIWGVTAEIVNDEICLKYVLSDTVNHIPKNKITSDTEYFSLEIGLYGKSPKISDIFPEYSVKDGYISGVKAGTRIEAVLSVHKSLIIKDKNGNSLKSGIIATGMTLTSGDEVYEFVITGDVNGDGSINAADYISVRLTILGKKSLSGAYYIAASLCDGKDGLSTYDYIKIRLFILGKAEIK